MKNFLNENKNLFIVFAENKNFEMIFLFSFILVVNGNRGHQKDHNEKTNHGEQNP